MKYEKKSSWGGSKNKIRKEFEFNITKPIIEQVDEFQELFKSMSIIGNITEDDNSFYCKCNCIINNINCDIILSFGYIGGYYCIGELSLIIEDAGNYSTILDYETAMNYKLNDCINDFYTVIYESGEITSMDIDESYIINNKINIKLI